MAKHRPKTSHAADATFPKYSISTVSEMTGVHPQQLRRYEQAQMVTPQRTSGNTRRYSDADVDLIERIQMLADTGVNQTGIEQILALQDALRIAEARAAMAEAQLHQIQQLLLMIMQTIHLKE
jgi:DNA-binding transcriptional MerR regulator